MKIEKSEIFHLQKKRRDDVGEIFEWKEKILRGIYPQHAASVKEFFESGFISELIQRGYFPESSIVDYQSDEFAIIVEHKRIWPVIFPQEWSFSMLKDAAVAVIDVAIIARQYGYNMKDCHGLNILFHKNRPMFVDLGSFHENKKGCTGWEAYQEFLRFYYYPLYTWKDGLEYISKLSIFSANLTPHSEHYIYRYRFLRHLKTNLTRKLINLILLPSNLAVLTDQKYERISSERKFVVTRGVWLLKKFIDEISVSKSQNLNQLKSEIKKIKRKETASHWKYYHSNISTKKRRFDKIIEHINTCCSDAKTAVDIAGNQGLFSLKVLRETNIEAIICQDLDEHAIDMGYKNHRFEEENISYVNYNAIAPITKTTLSLPSERFKCDMVFALAILHHLILSQGFRIDDILEQLGKYTKKYACVEFMPKGLWVHGAEITVPDWYREGWFRKKFEEYFKLLKTERTAENYTVYIGSLRV